MDMTNTGTGHCGHRKRAVTSGSDPEQLATMLQEMGINDDMANRMSMRIAAENQTEVQSQVLSELEHEMETMGTLTSADMEGLPSRDVLGCSIKAIDVASAVDRQESTATCKDPIVSSFDIRGIARYLSEGRCNRVVVLCGSGVGRSAGLPDLTEGSEFIAMLQEKHGLPNLEALFEKSYFCQNPEPFYELAKKLWPGNFDPTPSHYFIKLLQEKGLLQRCYTQNIDSLETLAGVPKRKVVAAHGNFNRATVLNDDPDFSDPSSPVSEARSEAGSFDKVTVDLEELKAALDNGKEGWQELRKQKGGLVKPCVTLKGEAMPPSWELRRQDLSRCDLLIVLGTSLKLRPFNTLLGLAASTIPRLLIHTQPSGMASDLRGGFEFQREENWRDVYHEADCDTGCRALAAALGWGQELEALIASKGSAAVERAPWSAEEGT